MFTRGSEAPRTASHRNTRYYSANNHIFDRVSGADDEEDMQTITNDI